MMFIKGQNEHYGTRIKTIILYISHNLRKNEYPRAKKQEFCIKVRTSVRESIIQVTLHLTMYRKEEGKLQQSLLKGQNSLKRPNEIIS